MTSGFKLKPPFAFGRRRLASAIERAFTLVELLVSMTFLVILMLVVTQVIGIVQRTWVRSNSRVSQFREARLAFDAMSRTLGQATLNTYWESDLDSIGPDAANQERYKAKGFARRSELQFVCGPTSNLLNVSSSNFPGHAVFFQAPLGITKLVAASTSSTSDVNTENMVNLLCGRGYFVEWGSDASFRPKFLESISTVPERFRMRLMEYSPTAEKNKIYAPGYRLLDPNDRSKVVNSRKWFQDNAVQSIDKKETARTRAATRPVAENILALVISPQQEVNASSGQTPTDVAPQYIWDSALNTNPGATSTSSNSQGTQHLLPPMVKVTMIALDQLSGEFLARTENEEKRNEIFSGMAGSFQNAKNFEKDLRGDSQGELGGLEKVLNDSRLNYRVFTTTIALKQSRWSL